MRIKGLTIELIILLTSINSAKGEQTCFSEYELNETNTETIEINSFTSIISWDDYRSRNYEYNNICTYFIIFFFSCSYLYNVCLFILRNILEEKYILFKKNTYEKTYIYSNFSNCLLAIKNLTINIIIKLFSIRYYNHKLYFVYHVIQGILETKDYYDYYDYRKSNSYSVIIKFIEYIEGVHIRNINKDNNIISNSNNYQYESLDHGECIIKEYKRNKTKEFFFIILYLILHFIISIICKLIFFRKKDSIYSLVFDKDIYINIDPLEKFLVRLLYRKFPTEKLFKYPVSYTNIHISDFLYWIIFCLLFPVL